MVNEEGTLVLGVWEEVSEEIEGRPPCTTCEGIQECVAGGMAAGLMPSEPEHQAGLTAQLRPACRMLSTYLLGFKLRALVAAAAQDEEGSKS